MAQNLKDKLLDAALDHVVFDGWSDETFLAAVLDVGAVMADARSECPRGALDLAAAFHKRGDQQMLAKIQETDLTKLRYSEKVAALVRFRLEIIQDKEIVRRGMAFFAMPQHAAEGSKLIWGTADQIWNALGDTSDDVNWYSKRIILSGVYGSTVLFWLGDTSESDVATWQFLDRRIANVMQFEKLKSQVRSNPLLKPLVGFADSLFGAIKAPSANARTDLPGYWPPRDTRNK